jgi:hypothetical protein
VSTQFDHISTALGVAEDGTLGIAFAGIDLAEAAAFFTYLGTDEAQLKIAHAIAESLYMDGRIGFAEAMGILTDYPL